jgi:ketosteroid isomerase-like protein
MSIIDRFLRYAAAFEDAFVSDDWKKVGPFFTVDAVYETFADPPFGGRVEGRAALMAAFKQVLDAFDRRFDTRAVEMLEGPVERDGDVWFRWAATYTLAGAPPLRIEGEETVRFEGDLIRRLEDRWPSADAQRALAYFAAHGGKLKAQAS